MLTVCVLAGALHLALPSDRFTLAWTHSIEKVRWEEDYRIDSGVLILDEARIRGSGAGMEPPPDAVLKHGIWHYRPANSHFTRLVLANSSFGGRYDICIDGRCRILASSANGGPTVIEPCPGR